MPVSRAGSRQTIRHSPLPSTDGNHTHMDQIDITAADGEGCSLLAPRKPKSKTQSRKPLVSLGEVIEISSDEDQLVPAPRPSVTAELRKQIKKLKEENSKYRQDLVETKQSLAQAHAEVSELKAMPHPGKGKLVLDASQLEDNVNCEICTAKLWSPYILPECGHTFCQSCLQDWFGTALRQFKTTHPHYNVNAPNPYAWNMLIHNQHALNAQMQQLSPQYTCPTCRVAVKNRPVEDFTLKSLVRVVAAASGESSPQKQLTAGNPRRGKGKTTLAKPNGPWDEFFPRLGIT